MRLELAVTAVLIFSGCALASAAVPGFHALGIPLFAEADTSAIPDWMKGYGVLISSAIGPLFTVWWAWYMTTKRLPEIEKEHNERVDGLIINFREDIKGFWIEKRADDRNLTDAINDFREAVASSKCNYQGPRPG